MRKLVLIALVSFTASVFAVSGLTQPRRRPPPGRRANAAQSQTPPVSDRIVHELGAFRWGMTHEQVLEQFRVQIRAGYAPRMKNLGQVEQYRLMDERQREIRRLENTYVVFDNAPGHRQWDSSFIGSEYTHNNNESMLVYEDARGNREFFLFINDRLWKRVQARNTASARIDFNDFATQLEAVFGPGRRVMEGTRLSTVEWRDNTTHLHLLDQTQFFSAFCLIYAEQATLGQIASLRINAPTKNVRRSAVTLDLAQPNTGAVTGDSATNIADRITGKMRIVQNADAGAAASATTGGTRPGATTTPAPSTGASTPDDPLGLGGLGI